MKGTLTALLSLLLCSCFAQSGKKTLLYASDFIPPRPGDEWVIELQPGGTSSVFTRNGTLILDTKGGVTVWFNQLLKGNIEIEYTRTVMTEGKPNDRLSDLNQFWMAKNPRNQNLFIGRNGRFAEYDSLQLYYVGMGGNANKTTRFRKYDGKGNKPIIKEYTDTRHLLEPGKSYQIQITVRDGVTTFMVNGEIWFTFDDPHPLKEGYFGFRSLHSRQEIKDFRVFQLP